MALKIQIGPSLGLSNVWPRWIPVLKASLKSLGLYFDSLKHITLNVWLRLLEGVTSTVFLV